MSVKPYTFDGGLLTAAAIAQGTPVPNLATRIIRAAAITNTTAAPVAASVNLVPQGGLPTPANALISGHPIGPGETYTCPELVNQGLNAGGTIQALGAGLSFKYTAVDII